MSNGPVVNFLFIKGVAYLNVLKHQISSPNCAALRNYHKKMLNGPIVIFLLIKGVAYKFLCQTVIQSEMIIKSMRCGWYSERRVRILHPTDRQRGQIY